MKILYIGRSLIATLLLIICSNNIIANTSNIQLSVVNERTKQIVTDATVFIDGKPQITIENGLVSVEKNINPITIHVSYLHGKTRHIESFHDVTLKQNRILLPVPDNSMAKLTAVFSMSAPFGGVPSDAKAVVLLPQPAFETGGLNFGFFNGIRIYSDQLQGDGNITLLMVALDKNLIPSKYGYFLDQAPEMLNQQILSFKPPFASGIVHDRQLLKWRKAKDAIDASDKNSICDFKAPPYTECGMRPQKGGIFSWTNVLRKKQIFHTPGAFLPSRTQGANPLLALPDSQIELAGHDDPLGFYPMNYARHRFLRFNEAPAEEVSINMPEILIGFQGDVGSDAIQLSEKNTTVSFEITAASKTNQNDLLDMDWAKFEAVWMNKKTGIRTIWHQVFQPKTGNNVVQLNNLPTALKDWQPTEVSEFSNVQVWLYGSDELLGYDNAIYKMFSGLDPFQIGKSAFRVTRWR